MLVWYDTHTNQSYFSREFINALDPTSPAWNIASRLLDDDNTTSIEEAYIYAYDHDMARKYVRTEGGTIPDPFIDKYGSGWAKLMDESPWIDDGGNFLPTFKNRTDVKNSDPAEGFLAEYTWLDISRYSGCVEDVNDDFKVDLIDLYMTSQNFGCLYPANWNSQCSLVDINEDNHIDLIDYFAIALMYGWTA